MAVGNPIGLGTCNYTLTFGAVDANTGSFTPLSNSITLHPGNVPSGTFVNLSTASYTVPSTSPYVGSQMGMMLTMSGFSDSLTTNDSTWGVYDNARITVGAVGPIAWTGTSDTNWSNAANWGGTAPGSSDVAQFNLNGTYPNQPSLSTAAAVGGLWNTGSAAGDYQRKRADAQWRDDQRQRERGHRDGCRSGKHVHQRRWSSARPKPG